MTSKLSRGGSQVDSRHGKAYWSSYKLPSNYTTMYVWSPDTPTPLQCPGTRRTPSTLAIPLRMPPTHVLSVPPASMALCTRLVATAIDSIDPSLLLLFPANSSLSMLRHILVTHFVDICIVTYSSSSPQGVYTKNRSASEHVDKLSVFFTLHPSWQNQYENVDRLFRIDPERNFRSEAFLTVAASFGSRLERQWCC